MNCPHCGSPVGGIDASGPNQHVFGPCGCSAATQTPRDLAGDEPRALTDGGTSAGGTERPPFVDPTAEYAECHFCGQTWEPTAVDGFDLSTEDEFYPKMVPVCPEHAGGCR